MFKLLASLFFYRRLEVPFKGCTSASTVIGRVWFYHASMHGCKDKSDEPKEE